MGLGENIDQLQPSLHFSGDYQADVFHAALASDRAIFVRNAREPQFARRLPAWWTAALGDASSFVILPIRRNGQAVALLYGDWLADLPAPQLDQDHFAALNELRALVAGALAGPSAAAPVRVLNSA